MKYFAYALIGIAGITAATTILLFNGFVLSTLWAWFAVTTFAVPAMSIPVAMGLSLFVTVLLKHCMNDVELKTAKQCVTHLADMVTVPAVALFYGFIITLFM